MQLEIDDAVISVKVRDALLGRHDSPLAGAITAAIASHQADVRQLAERAVTELLAEQDTLDALRTAVMGALLEGLREKVRSVVGAGPRRDIEETARRALQSQPPLVL